MVRLRDFRRKVPVSVRLDPKVLEWLKSKGEGHGFLPIQSIYADFYVVDELWPDFSLDQFHEALAWYQDQDVTLGG
jgi:hypothetical protein